MDAFGRRSVDEDLSETEEATALCGLRISKHQNASIKTLKCILKTP